MDKKKLPIGSVGVQTFRGTLRLRLPRQLYDGKQLFIHIGLRDTPENRKQVQQKAWQIEEDIRTGQFDFTHSKYKPTPIAALNKPLPTLVELWDFYSQFKKSQVAVTTFKTHYQVRYANQVKNLPTQDFRDVIQIRDWLLKNFTVDTAKRVLTQLSSCCRWAVKSGLIPNNPFAGLSAEIRAGKRKSIYPFTKAEVGTILEAFQNHPKHNHYHAFVMFLLLTGCRPGEAVALCWNHVSQDCSAITFAEAISLGIRKDTKTHTVRSFPCNERLKELLLTIRPDNPKSEELVFPARNGKAIDVSRFNHKVWKGDKSAGIVGIVSQLVQEGKMLRYRPLYNCRHTFITNCIEANVPVAQVARWVGNSPEIIYKHYCGITASHTVPTFF